MAHLSYSEKIWFSPCYVISELRRSMISKNKSLINKNKEAWICAVALLCRTKAEPTQWWIQIPKSDPPDVLAMNLISTENGNGNYMSILPVEVFEISENNCETIEKSIERKLVGDNGLKIKDYSKTMVVGFVRRKQIFNHEIVSDYIKNLNHKASAVYLIVNEENSTNFSFIGIFPDCFKYNCDWGAMCKNINQNDYIEMERASKTKPHVTKYTNDILTLVPE